MKAPVFASSFAVLLLAGCGGGGGGSNTGCVAITGGGTSATQESSPSCAGCTFADANRSIDGDLSTFGTLSVPSVAAGDGVVRATAQNGVAFPGGSRAGVYAEVTSTASAQVGTQLVLRTYLEGAPQEEFALVTTGVGSTAIGGAGEPEVMNFKTTKAFDSVEFGISGSAENFSANVHEFCSDS